MGMGSVIVSRSDFRNQPGDTNNPSLKQRLVVSATTNGPSAAVAKGQNERLLELVDVTSKTKEVSTESPVILNDPALAKSWGLLKSDAINAWKITQGSSDVVVAVIDTGVDIHHEDLDGSLWTNPGESGVVQTAACKALPEKVALARKDCNKATNGVDDDGNGFIDDVHGWNFVSNNSDLTDYHGHGTHISGIVAAKAGNGKGIAGIAPNAKVMMLKYFDPKVPNTDNLKNTINAIHYAVANGAKVINYSGGGIEFSADEKAAIEEARKKGILFVAAAGNERSNSDHHKYYPADYGLNNIISVTAINQQTE
ncbi:MAG: hypothetical protein C5B49_04075, partial [Bdellovibrio sp.]